MKRKLIGTAVPVIALCAAVQWTSAGIEGSKHDFSHADWSKDNACGACHSPHRESPPKAAPLWDQDADLSRTFGTPISQLAGQGTLICLRCHDGTVARDTLSAVAGDNKRRIHRSSLFDLGHGNGDHPVGIRYPSIDKGFHPTNKVIAGGAVVLPDGKVECISCHDPHNTSGEKYMLVTSNKRSALCLTCHKK